MKHLALQLRIKNIFLAALLLVAPVILAQEAASGYSIANEEIESIEPIEFTNYVGPYARVDSLADIIGIGTQLAQLDEDGRSNYAGKYSVSHIIGADKLLYADILTLSPTAGVDHIRNLRHIISGYLQAQYDYDGDAADTISTFITYYNAFYRGNLGYFLQKFSLAVNEALEEKSVGLSTNYADWPGATQIIIPLSANPVLEQEPSPNLDETGNKAVSNYLKENKGREQAANEMRQDMLDLRQDKLNEDQNILEDKQQKLQQENKEAQESLELAKAKEANTDDLETRQALREEQQQLKEQLQDNRKQQNEVNAVQQTIAQRQENLNKDQRELNQENPPTQPQTEEQEEAEETQEKVKPEWRLPEGAAVLLVPVKNRFFQFYVVDGDSLEIITRSKINSIRNMTIVANDSGYFVVAGKYNITETPTTAQENNRPIRLVQLRKNLKYVAQSNDDIHPDSGVWQHNGEFFAFLDNRQLGRFNMKMELQVQSAEVLLPDVPPQFAGAHVLVQNSKKQLIWLDIVSMNRRQLLKPTDGN